MGNVMFVMQPKNNTAEDNEQGLYRADQYAKSYGYSMITTPTPRESEDVRHVDLAEAAGVMEMMSKADVVFMTKGWEKDRMCRICNSVSRIFGIETVEEK